MTRVLAQIAIAVSIFFTVFNVTHCTRCAPVVQTVSGPVVGQFIQDTNFAYYSFQGIPYAEPPLGDLRFKPPVPKAAWNEVFNASNLGPVCPQTPGTYSTKDMSEDCLTLNVYVPATPLLQPIPVLIETSPGEFRQTPDGVFGPEFYMQFGIILVTFQYRLGALGFLSVLSEEAPGNAGLKDTLLALKWVKENIAQFGGDPDNVSFGGNSVGSVIVHYFLLSEQSTGLFHRAFLRSGSALGYRFLSRYPVETAMILGSAMGYQGNNSQELIQYLRQVDAFDIISATANLEAKDKRKGFRPFSPFVPVVERELADAFITRDPKEIIKTGMPQKVPIIVGFNAQEGIKMIPHIRKNTTLAQYLNDDFELCIPSNIEYPYGSAESVNLGKSIKEFYFHGEDISNASIYNYVDLISDTQFTFPTDQWIQMQKKMPNTVAIYYYIFDFDGDLNYYKLANNVTDVKGTAHIDDYGYMFATKKTKPLLATASKESLQTKEVILTLNTNFVSYGVPKLPNSVKWPDYSNSGNYLILNNQPRLAPGPPLKQRLQFWYKVYEDYEAYVKNGGVLERKIIP